jgi:hypothetical protein
MERGKIRDARPIVGMLVRAGERACIPLMVGSRPSKIQFLSLRRYLGPNFVCAFGNWQGFEEFWRKKWLRFRPYRASHTRAGQHTATPGLHQPHHMDLLCPVGSTIQLFSYSTSLSHQIGHAWNSSCPLIPLEFGCPLNRYFDGEPPTTFVSSALAHHLMSLGRHMQKPRQ